jgi:hypothetical protein
MAAPALVATSVSQCLRTLALAAGLCACAAHAQEVPPPAYQLAAQRAGVPSTVLYAVALQESGIRRNGRIVPWPWSLNVAGQSHRFATRADACAGLQQAMRSTSHRASTRVSGRSTSATTNNAMSARVTCSTHTATSPSPLKS